LKISFFTEETTKSEQRGNKEKTSGIAGEKGSRSENMAAQKGSKRKSSKGANGSGAGMSQDSGSGAAQAGTGGGTFSSVSHSSVIRKSISSDSNASSNVGF